jgi:hypothetical protein
MAMMIHFQDKNAILDVSKKKWDVQPWGFWSLF